MKQQWGKKTSFCRLVTDMRTDLLRDFCCWNKDVSASQSGSLEMQITVKELHTSKQVHSAKPREN